MTNARRSKQRGRRPSKGERRAAERRRLGGIAAGVVAGAAVAALVAVLATGGGGGERTKPADPGTVHVAGRARAAPLEAGEPVPAFSAPALEGGRVSWTPGTPTVLAVWAPWCPHCQVEMPKLARVAGEHPEVSFITVATALDTETGPDPVDYMAEHGLRFPVALDDEARTLAGALGIQGFPTVYYIGRHGRVMALTVGEVDESASGALVSALSDGGM
jgi:thiol-disulfide isomerase/thioredoxin